MWACLVALGLSGCSKGPQSTPVDPLPQSEPEDLSLDSAEYIRLGVPDPDREWSAADMKRAFEALSALAEKDPRQLPRYKSSRSGTCFARITDKRNLRSFRERSVPIKTRLPQAMTFAESSKQILKLYMAALLKGAGVRGELIELMGAQLRLMTVMLELAEEFVPTLDKNDPTYPTRIQAAAALKGDLATVVTGCLLTLSEDPYSIEDRQRLLDYLEETLPSIMPQLLPGARAETLHRIEKLTEDPSLRKLHPALRRLLGRLQGAAKKE
jgi:hypothetical protein